MQARDRVKLFRLAWDIAGNAFGSRQLLEVRKAFGAQADPPEPSLQHVLSPLSMATNLSRYRHAPAIGGFTVGRHDVAVTDTNDNHNKDD